MLTAAPTMWGKLAGLGIGLLYLSVTEMIQSQLPAQLSSSERNWKPLIDGSRESDLGSRHFSDVFLESS